MELLIVSLPHLAHQTNLLTPLAEYKDVLTTVCADDAFDNKVVDFTPTE
jgi:hypothetical protein